MKKYISRKLSLFTAFLMASSSLAVLSGCEEKTEPESAGDLYELIVNKPVVRIGQNEEVTVDIILGNGNYSVKSYDTDIAAAVVSGEQITITSGSSNGATTVEVTDGEGVCADISVNVGLFDLKLSQTELSMEPGDSRQLEVSMGNFSSNDELSIEVADGTVVSIENTDPLRPYYTVTALKRGHTSITFMDRKGKSAVVDITVNPYTLEVSAVNPKVGVDNKLTVYVVSGNGGYEMVSGDGNILAVEPVSGNETAFRLVGVSEGIATVTVADDAGQKIEFPVTVVLADKSADLGSGNYFSVPFEMHDGTVDETMNGLNSITFEARVNIASLNGDDNGNARINTVMGVEKIFLLRVDVHRNASDTGKRYLQLSADDKGGIRYEGSTEIQTEQWYNVAVVLDGSKSGSERISLYVNGVKETLQLQDGTPDDLNNVDLTSNFYIGRSDGRRHLNGSVTYARIWTRALTDKEIADNSGKILTSDMAGLAANWIFTNVNDSASSFASITGNSFEAEAGTAVTAWTADPVLSE